MVERFSQENIPEDEQGQTTPPPFEQTETPIPNVEQAGRLTREQEEALRRELEKYK